MSPILAEKPPVEGPRATTLVKRTGDEYVAFGNMEARNGLQERLEIPTMIRALGLPRGGRVLEVGCGRGIALPVLTQRLAPELLVGVDIDPTLVELAKRRVKDTGIGAYVLHEDVRALPFESGTFDVVIDFGTCYHVSGGTRGAGDALREIARVLCVGGLFVHETPVAQHLAHPVRSFGRTLPWSSAPLLERVRTALLWSVRRKRFAES
jgi:SAM-dependent methyltransferase